MAFHCTAPDTVDDGPKLRLTILPDALSVLATVTAPGELETDVVEAALAAAGVTYGIQPEAIESLCAGEQKQAVIARGEAPRPGTDTRFEPLIPHRRESGKPTLLPDGRVDYLNLGYAESVRVGDPLMRRIPPTAGRPGCNVRGEMLTCRDGHDRSFRRVGLGTKLSPEDPDLLVAAVSGLPTYGPDYVRVDPVLWLSSVDVGTGHIHFAGTVIVAGDVASGLRIDADRDVIVTGTVEAAEIRAGGNVELRGGMVGQGSGLVAAGGSVTARYLDNVTVTAGEDLYFEETISHSDVSVCRDISAVAAYGRGQIIGGTARAGRQVRTKLLGAPAGTATTVVVGLVEGALQQRAQDRLVNRRHNLTLAMQEIIRLRVAGEHGAALEAAQARFERLQAEVQLADLAWELVQPAAAKDLLVEAASGFFGGVAVQMGELRRTLQDDLPGAKLVVRSGNIALRF